MSSQNETPLILNVDDDDAKRYVITRILSKAGYRVKEVASGSEALEYIHVAPAPDLVLLDVNLPDVHGFEVCRKIKGDARTSSLPVVHLSATSVNRDDRINGLEGGADAYLTETLDPGELLATIRALLRTKRAEEESRELAAQWQNTFDAIDQGIVFLDRNRKIIRFNMALTQFTGTVEGGLAGAAAGDIPVLRNLPAISDELNLDGKWFQRSLHQIAGGAAGLGETVAVISDITERKALEERMRDAHKLESIGLLAGGIAHDFNNLLVGVLGSVSLILEDLPKDYGMRPSLETIGVAAERACELTRQLLAYAGKGHFFLELVDLSEVVRETVKLSQAAIPKGIEVVLDLSRDLPSVEADRSQMQQIVMNLVMNAAEAFPEKKGMISVSTERVKARPASVNWRIAAHETAPESVLLEVTDNGAGMDEATKARMFDPFFTTKFMGRGLGLAAVQGIVRGHKGSIGVESNRGSGTRVSLMLPAASRPAGAPQIRTRRASRAQAGTILLVDDEPVVRATSKAMLERHGHVVLLASDGREAVNLFRENPAAITLVVLDLTMPVMSGDEALREMQAIKPDVRVLLSSGYNQSEIMRRFEGRNVSGYLQKPYRMSELTEAIDRVLGEPGPAGATAVN